MLNQYLGLPFSRHADEGYGLSDQQRGAYLQALYDAQSRLCRGDAKAEYNTLRAQMQRCVCPACTQPTFFQEIDRLRVLLKKLRFEVLWDLDKQVKRLEGLVEKYVS